MSINYNVSGEQIEKTKVLTELLTRMVRKVIYFASIPENKKACNHLICRLLVNFDISLCGVSWSPLEHLEVILAVIREVYSKK